MNATPTMTVTVEAVRPPRMAAAIRIAPTTSEITESRPLDESPSTGVPLVVNGSSRLTRPRMPNTHSPIAKSTAPTRCTASRRP
jgi:hypothetical protein